MKRGERELIDSRPGLYLHVPFCSAICPYCDFAVVRKGHPLRKGFVGDLTRELSFLEASIGEVDAAHPWSLSQRFGGTEFGTVYLGGGTPTALGVEGLGRVCELIKEQLPVANDALWSLEANPEDVSGQALRDWSGLGFAYLSLGVQSFDQATLSFLGRRHSADQALLACAKAADSDFETVSIDLMYGMHGLDRPGWTRVLTTAASFSVGHLSCYELTVHEGTAFGRLQEQGNLATMQESGRAEQFRQTLSVLQDAGFAVYEVSNFARTPAERSPHNQKYWRSVPYLGIGPSAHSYDGDRRWWNQRALREWSAELRGGRTPVGELEVLSDEQKRMEWLLTRLRTVAGGDLSEYRRLFGHGLIEQHGKVISELERAGLISLQGGMLRPTVDGLLVADALVGALAD